MKAITCYLCLVVGLVIGRLIFPDGMSWEQVVLAAWSQGTALFIYSVIFGVK